MEFILKTDVEQAMPAVIDFNHEELKAELALKLKDYNGLVVTPDAIKDAKADRAILNRLRTAIEDKRKEVKAAINRPYLEFERKCKEIVSMVDEPIAKIDEQVKAFENAEKEDKRKELQEYFNQKIGDLGELVLFGSIWNEKWLNKSVTAIQAMVEIDEKLFKIGNDIKVLRAMNLENEEQVVSAYLRRYDMADALSEKVQFEEMRKQLQKLDGAKPAPEPEPAPVDEPAEVVPKADEAVMRSDLKTIKVIFHDTTAAFRADMRALTEKHCIKYGGIQ